MIRAHLATFPPRKEIMLETIHSIYNQVDKIFILLNEYDVVPQELTTFGNIEAVIPDYDQKDTGKFFFPPADDDVVFSIDDDII